MSFTKRVVKTTCKSCHEGCRAIVTVENEKITHIEGDPNSLKEGMMCAKGLTSIVEVYNPNLILYPMERVGGRGKGKWRRVSWEGTLDLIAEKIKKG